MFTGEDHGFAMFAAVVGTTGLLLMVAADRISHRIKSKVARVIFALPLGLLVGLLGFFLLGAVVLLAVANVFGPILLAIWLMFKPN